MFVFLNIEFGSVKWTLYLCRLYTRGEREREREIGSLNMVLVTVFMVRQWLWLDKFMVRQWTTLSSCLLPFMV